MSSAKLIPVYRGPFADAALLKSFIESDGVPVTMAPDVASEPLQSPGAHTVWSRYTEHVLLVSEDDVERAEELIESYFDAK